MRAILPPCSLLVFLATVAVAADPVAQAPPETAADTATRALLDVLEERQMSDVMLAVLARVEADPQASKELKREAAFRRAAALIGVSRTEADSGKRAKLLDEAQASLEAFLKSGAPNGRQAIAAYTQKGSLLVERGRSKAEQANRPGADAKTLQAEAVKFFDEAFRSLKSTAKAGEPITNVTNAEDAVLQVLREVDGRVAALKQVGKADEPKANDKAPDDKAPDKKADAAQPDSKPRPPKAAKPVRLTIKQRRELEALETEQEALRGKLIQTRLTAAATLFEKAKAYPEKSKERTDTLTASAVMFKEIADKYPTKGGGLFARYYEGRNYAMLGKWEVAANTVLPITMLDQKQPLAILLRSRACNTLLECLLAEKKFDKFDVSIRKFALEDVSRLPGAKLDADWLGFKYRVAKALDTQADALDPKDAKAKGERAKLQADAKKLAVEVAKANADFADEARELSAKLGKVVEEGERTFAAAFDEAKVALTTMQGHAGEAKAAVAAKDAAKEAAARKAATEARTETVAKLEEALKLAGIAAPLTGDSSADQALKDVTIDEVNQARYYLTFLLYEAGKFPEAAGLGRMLAERYPNAKGSLQAAKIAMAAWQQVGQQAAGEARDQARKQAAELAGIVMKTWPDQPESADAAVIAIGAAASARDPKSMVAIIGQVPASSPRSAEVKLRAGMALWREVQEARRRDDADRPDDAAISAWRATAAKALDEGLAGLGEITALPPAPLGQLAVAGALSRVQIAMEDNDDARASALLQHPVYGPWTLVAGDKPALPPGPLAEAALTLALRLFIQTEDFAKAQQAMAGLEKAAGQGVEASAKLTAMYFSMGRDLQSQLESLGSGEKAASPEVRQRAEKILTGFETFLDGIAARDPKPTSQMWVATTYLTLGSGKGTGAVVPPSQASAYLKKSAEVYQNLLAKTDSADVKNFEPSIRLKMATIYQVLANWAEAQKQIDWILSDAKRQNSLEAQVMAAEVLQAAGEAAAKAGNAEQANTLLREAASGRKAEPIVIWGWGNIADKVVRQGIEAADPKTQQNRDTFFDARLQVVTCLLARARLPGKEQERASRLTTAETAIAMTRKLYPDLGGPAFEKRYEQVLRDVQKEQGKKPDGFQALDAKAQPAAPAAQETTGATP